MPIQADSDALPVAVLTYDLDGTVTSANQAAATLLGSNSLAGTKAADAGWLITDAAGWPDRGNFHPALEAARTGQPQSALLESSEAAIVGGRTEQLERPGRPVPRIDERGLAPGCPGAREEHERVTDPYRLAGQDRACDGNARAAISGSVEALAREDQRPRSVQVRVTRALSVDNAPSDPM